uniref:C2 domain-containing protein n=1 Tax=Plectus sambesii TaxID=2011161 RepID=A0A914X228_9BILA
MTAVPPSSGSNGSTSDSKGKYCQLQVQIVGAKLNGVSGFLSKPDVYAELLVDASPSKKTVVKKKTSSPQWEETFTVLVTESSVLEFKVFGKSKLFEDSLIGQKTLKLSHAVRKESDNGKFDNTKVLLNLTGKDSSKAGELRVALTGILPKPKPRKPEGVPNGVTNGEVGDGAQEDHYQLVNGVISIKVSDGQQAGGEHARRPEQLTEKLNRAIDETEGFGNE